LTNFRKQQFIVGLAILKLKKSQNPKLKAEEYLSSLKQEVSVVQTCISIGASGN